MDGNAASDCSKILNKNLSEVYNMPITLIFPICICFIFLRLTILFCKALLDPVFPAIAMQIFNFKNSIIAIKLFIVMILNLYLTSV